VERSVNKIERDFILDIRPLRTVAYCRVSKQDLSQEHSIQAQIDYYRNYIRKRVRWRYAGIYFDKASGLNKDKRRGFQKMLEACRNGEVDQIVAKSISRFGRNTIDVLKVLRELKSMNIGVYFEIENLDSLDSSQYLMIELIASIAQDESKNRSENIKWGMRHSMSCGNIILNDKNFLGYRKNPTGDLVIVEDEAKIVRIIFNLFLQGYGYRKIKEHLEKHNIKTVTGKDTWSTSTIDRILSNEKYVGHVLLQKTYVEDFLSRKQIKNDSKIAQYLVENNHEPIIPKEMFLKAQELKTAKSLKK